MAKLMLHAAALGGFQANLFPDGFPGLSAWKNFRARASLGEADTQHPFNGSGKPATMHSAVMTAVACLAAPDALDQYRPRSGVVKVKDDLYMVEFHHSDNHTTFVQYNSTTGRVESLVLPADSPLTTAPHPTLQSKGPKTPGTNCVPIFLAVLAGLCDHEPHVQQAMQKISGEIAAGTPGSSTCEAALFRVCDAMYHGLKNEKGGVINLQIPADGNLSPISKGEIFDVQYDEKNVLAGKPHHLLSTGKTCSPGALVNTMGDLRTLPFVQEYVKNHSSHWTKEEEALIPIVSDEEECRPEVREIAEAIAMTAESALPMVNFGWYAGTGYGKTTGARHLASLLHKPYVSLTCSNQTEVADFFSELIPDTRDSTELSISHTQIGLDPESVYEALTGDFVSDVTPDEVMAEYVRQKAAGENSMPRYMLKRSKYITALEKGYLVEVQEESRISNPGVLVGLNGCDQPGARIPLADGSQVVRHKDAIVLSTDNLPEECRTCNAQDASVIRRKDMIFVSEPLEKADVISQVMRNTGVRERSLIEKMYTIWDKVRAYATENELAHEGGSVTVVELTKWVQSFAVKGFQPAYIRSCCINTVVNKATRDSNEIKAIMAEIVDPEMSRLKLLA